jgi:hypothetical protein
MKKIGRWLISLRVRAPDGIVQSKWGQSEREESHRDDGDRTKGHIAADGAIDRPQIREAIENVIEGDTKAFELRRQKYGF